MGKSKELSIDLKDRIIDLNMSGKPLGAISKQLDAPRVTVQTFLYIYSAWDSCVTAMIRMEHKISPVAERKSVRAVMTQPKTINTQICNELEAAGKQVIINVSWRLPCKKEALAPDAAP